MMKKIDSKTLAHDVMLLVGMSVLLVCAILPLLKVHWQFLTFVFAFGALLVLAARLVEQYHGSDMRVCHNSGAPFCCNML